MGEQLYAVVYKKHVPGRFSNQAGEAGLAEKLPEWEALDRVPGERLPEVRPITESTLTACVLVHALKLSQEFIHEPTD